LPKPQKGKTAILGPGPTLGSFHTMNSKKMIVLQKFLNTDCAYNMIAVQDYRVINFMIAEGASVHYLWVSKTVSL
jgi:hypothetical protein